jgi:hypothetical protein
MILRVKLALNVASSGRPHAKYAGHEADFVVMRRQLMLKGPRLCEVSPDSNRMTFSKSKIIS